MLPHKELIASGSGIRQQGKVPNVNVVNFLPSTLCVPAAFLIRKGSVCYSIRAYEVAVYGRKSKGIKIGGYRLLGILRVTKERQGGKGIVLVLYLVGGIVTVCTMQDALVPIGRVGPLLLLPCGEEGSREPRSIFGIAILGQRL